MYFLKDLEHLIQSTFSSFVTGNIFFAFTCLEIFIFNVTSVKSSKVTQLYNPTRHFTASFSFTKKLK